MEEEKQLFSLKCSVALRRFLSYLSMPSLLVKANCKQTWCQYVVNQGKTWEGLYSCPALNINIKEKAISSMHLTKWILFLVFDSHYVSFHTLKITA